MSRRHRMRTRYRGAAVAVVLAVVLVFAVSFGYANVGADESHPALSEGATTVPGGAGADAGIPGRSVEPDPPLVKATPAAAAELLTRLLPPGEVANIHRTAYDGPEVFLTFTRNGIFSYLSLNALAWRVEAKGCTNAPAAAQCSILPGGTVAHVFRSLNCLENTIVRAYRPSGLVVEITVSTCTNHDIPVQVSAGDPEAPQTLLSPAEVLLSASNEEWGVTMRSELVEAGRRNYPQLPLLR